MTLLPISRLPGVQSYQIFWRNLVSSLLLTAIWVPWATAQETSSGLAKQIELHAHRRLEALRLSPNSEPAPFTSDGCSGGMSATWDIVARMIPGFEDIHMASPPWEDCCVAHDRVYHRAGSDRSPKASYNARLATDEALQTCVRMTADKRRDQLKKQYEIDDSTIDQAYDLISASMFDAVRFGGAPCSGLPWRWGYGWPHCGVFSDW